MPEGFLPPEAQTELSGYAIAGGVGLSGEPAVILILTERASGHEHRFPMHPRDARAIAAGLEEAADRIERKIGDA